MADAVADDVEEEPKPSKLPLIIGLVGALGGAGGGFFATYSGMILGSDVDSEAVMEEIQVEPLPDVAYVPIPTMTVSVGPGGTATHLRFQAQIEVPSNFEQDVAKLMPRILDVLNGYLRALDAADLEAQSALMKLRLHMLKRIEIVVGRGRVNDLLVTEFVLN